MNKYNNKFERVELLLGEEVMNRIRNSRVIIFGVGGVGSWCAESLVRSGIGHLTMVDSDLVSETNINRQLMATTATVGQIKVNVLKDRLLEINPDANIMAEQKVYNKENSESFCLDKYDYIIDAIDSLEHKIHLIQTATRTDAVFFSSMGAALKMDMSRIKTAEFWKVQGCPLAAALRRKFRKMEMPAKKFICVYSDEVLQNRGTEVVIDKSNIEEDIEHPDWNAKKAKISGTIAHITAAFGFNLAALVLDDIYKRTTE